MHRPVVFTEAEAADMLACDIDTLRQRAGRGEIVGLKVGRGWVFPAVAFEASINQLALREAQAAGKQRAPAAPRAVTVTPLQARRPPTLPALGPFSPPDPRL
jgi:hypothetical protein